MEPTGNKAVTSQSSGPHVEPQPSPDRLERASLPAFLVFWAVWMSVLGFVWTRHPGLDHGDAFTDACVLSAGRNFDRLGMSFNWGIPQLESYIDPAKPKAPYTHYPPGPWWIHQALKAAGLGELWELRLVAVVITAAGALLLMLVMSRLAGSWFIGALAAFFYTWSAPFSGYADSIYQFAYGQATLFGLMGAWLAFERSLSARRRRLWLAVAAALFFVDGWITFEHAALVPIFLAWRVLLLRRRALLPACALMVCVPVIVLSLRLAHNAAALGSVQTAVDDMLTAVHRRAGYEEGDAGFRHLAETWKARLGGSALPPDHRASEFQYPVLRLDVLGPALVLALVAAGAWRHEALRPMRQALGNALSLIVAGGAWFVFLKQHAIVHRHVVMLLLPGLSLLLGCLAGWGILQFSRRRSGRSAVRWVGPIAAAVLFITFSLRMRESIALNQIAELHPAVRDEVLQRRAYFQCVSEAGEALSDVKRLAVLDLYPQAAYLLGRPFEYVEAVPPDLGPDEALWVTFVTPYERQAAFEALNAYGFPDVLSEVAGSRLIFRGEGTRHEKVNVLFEGTYRLTNARFTSSLDGGSWVAQLRFEGPFDAATDRDLTVFCHAVDTRGNAVKKLDVPLSWAMGDQTTAASSHVIARSDVPGGARLVVGLWSAAAGRPLRISPDRIVLPDGARLSANFDYFSWTPRPWR